MTIKNWSSLAGLLVAVSMGCAERPGPAPVENPSTVPAESPARRVDVDAGPGGVDVDVTPNSAHKNGGVGVDVDAGGVDVNVQGDGKVLDRIQERREERKENP